MSTTKEVKDKLVKKVKEGTKPDSHKSLEEYFEEMARRASEEFPKEIDANRIAKLALIEVKRNPRLLQVSPSDVLKALVDGKRLGLEPGTLDQMRVGVAKNRQTNENEAKLEIGYKGLLDLVNLSKTIKWVSVHAVFENDEFEFGCGSHKKLRHIPKIDGDRGAFKLAYAVAKFKNGGYAFAVVGKDKAEKMRAKIGSGLRNANREVVAKKLAIKKLCELIPTNEKLHDALNMEEG